MHLMGTSYVNMNMSGTVVDRSSSRHHTDLRGKIHPSVALNIAATMGVIAGRLSSTGVRLNTRLYTATAVEIALTLRGFQMMKLDLSLPHSRQEIFAYK
ncbi:unnamed protein product [Plutella xylostella]|uniref:(diamondback moth) hypothetical protein n=2 Tax=Plutella xylostella TaxID=51655 RepID=A0A8S4F2H1_PLUXY|nr:unnamed protein product [Plutella xylostella]